MSKTILTVDDSTSLRKMLSFSLEAAGYKVVDAEDGVDGVAKASSGSFDLVLTDQNMPSMDGLTLIARLREMPRYRSVPILMLTTESSPEMKNRGREAGATGWMVKPFDPVKLISVVNKLIGA
jgi:two-component system, chemotaxis family, chemotaxis protein CheY